MIKIEEKSIELALIKAAGILGVTQSELKHKVIKETSGFLGLFGRKICIEAWTKSRGTNYRRERENTGRTNKQHSLNKNTIPSKKYIHELQEYCHDICAQLVTGEEQETVLITHSLENDRVLFDISNEYLSKEISKNIKIAESLEHLLRKKLAKITRGEFPFRVFVDAGKLRQKREQELIIMAKDLSKKVSIKRRPIVLNYKSAYDRKIIHITLESDSRVYTKSIGMGQNRKLMILPSKKGE